MPLELPSMRLLGLLAIGGALGTVSRYLVGGWLSRSAFPWGTVAVNVTGSFLLAVLMFGAVSKGWFGPDLRTTLGVAFLGAFTTMSTFAYESLALAEDGAFAQVAGFFVLNPIACLVAAYLGRVLAYAVPEAGGV